MKLEKDDRIISNADYEKLVGLAELHESAITEVVKETIKDQLTQIKEDVILAKRELEHLDYLCTGAIEKANERFTIIQEKNAEIARLKKRWWKLI